MFKTILSSLLLTASLINVAHAEDPLDKIASLCSYDNVVYYGETDRAKHTYYLLCKHPEGIKLTYGDSRTLQEQGHYYYDEDKIHPIIGHSSSDDSSVLELDAPDIILKIGETSRGDYDMRTNAVVSFNQQGQVVSKIFLVKRSIINGIRQFYDDQY